MISRIIYSVIFFSLIYSNIDHLIFNRITIRPNEAELISIYNPTSEDTVDLSNYYITDSNLYYNLPSGENFWSESIFDLIIRFPDGYSIESGESIIIGISDDFADYYGYDPVYDENTIKDNSIKKYKKINTDLKGLGCTWVLVLPYLTTYYLFTCVFLPEKECSEREIWV